MISCPALKPRLILKRSRGTNGEKIKVGYLQYATGAPPMYIGPVISHEYRLVQTLFSPLNIQRTRFQPMPQTIERVYENMFACVRKELPSRHLMQLMNTKVSRVLRSLQKTEAGKYFVFDRTNVNVITMSIIRSGL